MLKKVGVTCLGLLILMEALSSNSTNAQSIQCIDRAKSVAGICSKIQPDLRRATSHAQPELKSQINAIAEYLKRNPKVWSLTRFRLVDGSIANNMCCSCVPGENCSSQLASDVCSSTPTGSDTCPQGEFRAVCTKDSQGLICTSIGPGPR